MLEQLKGVINTQQFEQQVLGRILPGGTMRPAKRGTAPALDAYNRMPWLHAVCSKVGGSVSSVCWELYVDRAKDGTPKMNRRLRSSKGAKRKSLIKQMELQEIESHPFLDALEHGNAQMPGMQLLKLTQMYLDLVGECFWIKERNGQGMPIAFWPLPAHWITDMPTVDRPFYKVGWNQWHGDIPVTEIVCFHHPDPLNPYERGSGTAKALADELETDEFAAQYTRSFFQNRARPDLIISGKNLSKEDTRRMEIGWLQRHAGFWKAFKPSFISGEVTVTPLNNTMKDNAMVELRQFERDTILQVYGVPPELFGILSNSNRSTIDSADYLYAKHVLVPRLDLLCYTLQEQVIPDYDVRLVLDYESPVEEDKEFKLNVAKAAPWALTQDEWRELGGWDELPEGTGQLHMVPVNLISRTATQEPAATAVPLDDVAPKQLAPRQKTLLNTQDVVQVSNALDDPLVKADVHQMVSSITAALVAELGAEFINEYGTASELAHTSRVSQFITTQTMDRSNLADAYTKNEVRRVLLAGVQAGDNVEQMAISLQALFRDWAGYRVNRIAMTESTRITSFASTEAMQQAGIEKKEWITTRDGFERDSHAALDGQVVLRQQKFTDPLTGQQADMPGNFGIAAQDINCFLPETTVGGEVVAASKVFYEGKALRIKTASGKTLSVTRNHRVLTPKGFVAACDLRVGDNLVAQSSDVNVALSQESARKENSNVTVEQVFEALAGMFPCKLAETSFVDFHGDAAFCQKDVHIVLAKSCLRLNNQSALAQSVSDKGLVPAHTPGLAGGSFGKDVNAVPLPASCVPSTATLPQHRRAVVLDGLPLDSFLFGCAPKLDASLYQVAGQDTAVHTELFSKLVDTCSTQVCVDNVVEIIEFDFRGHVYDLQTVSGIVAANGVIASNCRCAVAARFEGQEDRSADQMDAVWKMNEAKRVSAEKQLAQVIQQVFNRQQQVVLERLRNA